MNTVYEEETSFITNINKLLETQSSEAHASKLGIHDSLLPIEQLVQPINASDFVRSCPVVVVTQLCDELVGLFRSDEDLECVIVCDDFRHPIGLIMKHRFFKILGSLYGMSLYGQKPIAFVMDQNPLIANMEDRPQEIIDRALSRSEETFYDVVVMVNNSEFAGVLSVSDLLNMSRLLQKEATNLQVRTVRGTESMIDSIHQAVSNVKVRRPSKHKNTVSLSLR